MHKKFMLACMVIAAFAAFVMAPVASAATITSETKVVPVGTSITGINTGVTKFTGPFNVECDHDHLTGVVTKNTDAEFEGEIPIGNAQFNGTAAGTDCTSALGATKVTVNSKLCLKQVAGTDTVNTTGCGGNVTFTLEITGTGPCKYSTASVSGTFTTNSTPATATISEQAAKKEEGGIFCPGEGKLDLVFDLHTTGKTSNETGAGITIS
ncbi:MAG: hypothetical protein ACTHLH_08955 [Solirubrobacterales bacterium]